MTELMVSSIKSAKCWATTMVLSSRERTLLYILRKWMVVGEYSWKPSSFRIYFSICTTSSAWYSSAVM